MDPYHKALAKVMQDESPAESTTMTREEIEADIAAISKLLIGPMANGERLDLVETRRALRKQRAAMNS